MANYSDAEVISRRMLEPIRFSAEASVEIVNFELARKMQSKKPDVARLDAVRKLTAENATNSAIYCILDKRSEMIGAIKAEFSCDKRFRYVFQRWPVFATLRADKEILTIFG